MLKFNTPGQVAFITSFVVSVILLILSLLFYFFAQQFFSVHILLFAPIVGFGVCYIVLRYALEKFIYDKIKIIYKTIHSYKTNLGTGKLDLSENVLEKVNTEVVSWAHSSSREIADLRTKEAYRREFIGNVAHEIRTPIFNIQGYIHTLLDGGLEDEEVNRKFLIRADKSVDRMINLIQDLEAITQLESGMLDLVSETFNIVELVSEIMDQSETKAVNAKIQLQFDDDYEKPIFVKADRKRIIQVYANLIENSIKYGKEGGTTRMRFFDMGENILCEVADDGSGIGQKHLPRLFERFYRIDRARTTGKGGSGLGLAIVKHIIEAHGQSINVRSATGERSGTTFSFTLEKA